MHIMGILNVTPDSFSDGGDHFGNVDKIVTDALQMIDEGADIIDIGGQSTRPGAQLATPEQEYERVIPVLEHLRKHLTERSDNTTQISIDTMSSTIAKDAISKGADIINDVSAGQNDPNMASIIAQNPEIKYITMHNRGQGSGMRSEGYGDIIQDIIQELSADIDRLLAAGVQKEQIIFDPGPGFSKATGALNWPILARFEEFKDTGYPVLFAASRKRFIGELLRGTPGETAPKQRDIATAATSVIAYQKGAWCVRVHNVRATVDAVKVAMAIDGVTND